ncbi:MAG: Kelch repeat-containing protein [Solimonas sp.]
MSTARDRPASVLLANGRVLVAGGYGAGNSVNKSAELYNPASKQWNSTGSMQTGRTGDFLILLDNGKVLALGGTPELYDAAAGTWSATTAPPVAVGVGSHTLLADGRVLAIPDGGANALIYDPGNASWTNVGGFDGRVRFAATLLDDGRVLISGGCMSGCATQKLATTLLYDPDTNHWSSAGNMHFARYEHLSNILPDGRVVVSHGVVDSSGADISSEVFDPGTGTWALAGNVIKESPYTRGASGTVLKDGRVLVAGGAESSMSTGILDNPQQGALNQTNAEVFSESGMKWDRATAPGTGLKQPRYYHTAVRLPDGSVLIAGGSDSRPLSAAEVFHP